MPIEESYLQELKSRVNIVDVARERVHLVKAGKNYKACCPFHQEKTPSFVVYPESNSFYCFGCNEGGGVIDFVMKIENVAFPEAVRMLAARAGMEEPSTGSVISHAEQMQRTRILEANREAARFFYRRLVDGQEGTAGKDYLRTRQVSDQMTRHFGLGFAPPGGTSLVNWMKRFGFTEEELADANLATKTDDGRIVDRFRNRLMFPIINPKGEIIAFGGRALGDHPAKYLNTSTTAVYEKSRDLFAANFARVSHERDTRILAEGYMDVIALHQAGFDNAIATLGTALTEQQARIIARSAKEVIICYDSDNAGRKATERAISLLRDQKINVRVAEIPGAKDPDEFLKRFPDDGKERLENLFAEAPKDVDYLLFKCEQAHDLATSKGRVDYATEAADILNMIESPVEKDVYAGVIADVAGIDKASLLSEAQRPNPQTPPQKSYGPEISDMKTKARYHAWIHPNMNEESEVAAVADVVINGDYRINGVQLLLLEDDSLDVRMPDYIPKGTQEPRPYVEMDTELRKDLTRFLIDSMDFDKDVEVIGGGNLVDLGTPSYEVRLSSRENVEAFVNMETAKLKFNFLKVLNSKNGLYVTPPHTSRVKDESGKTKYIYPYEFTSKSSRGKLRSEVLAIYNEKLEQAKKRDAPV